MKKLKVLGKSFAEFFFSVAGFILVARWFTKANEQNWHNFRIGKKGGRG